MRFLFTMIGMGLGMALRRRRARRWGLLHPHRRRYTKEDARVFFATSIGLARRNLDRMAERDRNGLPTATSAPGEATLGEEMIVGLAVASIEKEWSEERASMKVDPLDLSEAESIHRLIRYALHPGDEAPAALLDGVADPDIFHRLRREVMEARRAQDAAGAGVKRTRAETAARIAAWQAETRGPDRNFLLRQMGWPAFLRTQPRPTPEFWHEVCCTPHDFGMHDQLQGAFWVLEDEDTDRATAGVFIRMVTATDYGILDGALSRLDPAGRLKAWGRFISVIERLDGGFYRHQTLDAENALMDTDPLDWDTPTERRGMLVPILSQSLAALAERYELPPAPDASAAFGPFHGGPETRAHVEESPYSFSNEGLELLQFRDDGIRPPA